MIFGRVSSELPDGQATMHRARSFVSCIENVNAKATSQQFLKMGYCHIVKSNALLASLFYFTAKVTIVSSYLQ